MERLILLNAAIDNATLTHLQTALAPHIVVDTAEAGTLISSIIGSGAGEQVILADGCVLQEQDALIAALTVNQNTSATLFDIHYCDDYAAFESLLPESVISGLTHPGNLPALMIKLPGTFLQTIEEAILPDGRETVLRCAITAIAQSIEIYKSSSPLDLSTCGSTLHTDLSGDTRSRLLSYAVGSINIEDLFPMHPWDQHEEESAATCFHTLAAHFIRYGDLKAAEECLSFSDRLEDSPRALALRGLISKQNGETLGAVANLVSSLQGYESRKRSAAHEHYINFTPTNLEVINNSLHNGLSALNNQDNDSAFSHFARAVYNFDSFFASIGLESPEQ